MNRIFMVCLSALLGACAGAPVVPHSALPGWVEHPEKSYGPERFLVTVGSGGSREEAVREAKKQMAEVFQTRVQSITRVKSDSSLRQNTEGLQTGSAGQDVSRETTFESNVRLRGAEAKESVVEAGTHYVLLALDKLRARSGLLLEANRSRDRLTALLDSLEIDYQVLKREEARAELAKLSDLSGEASVLGMGVLVEAASLEGRLARIESDLRARNEKRIFLVRTLKGDDQFSRGLETCIQDQGASVSAPEGGVESVNQVLVSVVEHPEHLAVEGWVKIRYEVTASIFTPKGRSYRISEQRSETARSREAGLESAAAEIAKGLCQKLWSRIVEMK